MNDLMDKIKGFHWRKLLQYFLQGIIIVAPIGLTLYFVYTLITTLDNWLPPIFKGGSNYGLGFVIIIVTIIIIGYLSTFFIRSRIFGFVDRWMEKTPGIKFIYSTTKDFFGAFAGNKKKFNKPVLVNIDSHDVWRIGFVTEEDLAEFDMEGYMAVYIPMSYSIAGQVYFVKADRIKIVESVSATDAMKFAISGGVADVEDNEEEENIKK
jgi:uncharacterized membrane protein